jgi:hypothetical protein
MAIALFEMDPLSISVYRVTTAAWYTNPAEFGLLVLLEFERRIVLVSLSALSSIE